MLKKIIKNKLIFSILSIFLLVGLFSIFPDLANAQEVNESIITRFFGGSIMQWVLTPTCWLLFAIVKLLASVLIVIIQILIAVSSYNDFIKAPAVTEGWTIVRDVANMFFVVVLLIIAISTILGIETYNYKKLLPKLLLMAILINFSKMICGLLIDVSQIATMTFVNGYREAAAGNFATAFGLDQLLKFSGGDPIRGEGEDKAGSLEIVAALILAFVLVVVAIAVTLGTILIFLIRIVMLWFLVVLSPIAYLASTFPGGAKYSGQWWTEFTKYLIVGPAMAFFLWLSLTVMSTADTANDLSGAATGFSLTETGETSSILQKGAAGAGNVGGEKLYVAITGVSSSSHLLSYIIAIGMLCGSMMMAQQIGVAGAGMASNLVKKIGTDPLKKMGLAAFKAPFKVARHLGKEFGEKMYAGELRGGFGKGILLNPQEIWKKWEEGVKRKSAERMRVGDTYAGMNMGAGGVKGGLTGMGAESYCNEYTLLRGFGKVARGGGWSTKNALEEVDKEIKDEEPEVIKQMKGPEEKEIDDHLKKLNLEKDSKEEGKEKVKFIADWKQEKIKEYSKGPSKEEIKKGTEGMLGGDVNPLNRVRFINSWKEQKREEYGVKKNSTFDSVAGLYKKQERFKKFMPDMLKDKINEKVSIGKAKEEMKDQQIPTLIDAFKKALSGGNKIEVKAALSLLTEKEGLDNLIKKHGFSDNTAGYVDFMNETTEKLKMNSQEGFELENDIGILAEKAGQTRFGRTIKTNKDGEYEQRTSDEISETRYTEIEKAQGAREILSNKPDFVVENNKATDNGKLIIQDNLEAIGRLLNEGRMHPSLIKFLSKEEELLRKLWSKEEPKKVEDLLSNLGRRKESYADRIAAFSRPTPPPPQEQDINNKAKEIRQLRESNAPGFEWETIRQMIIRNNRTPDTNGAHNFMMNFDREEAIRQLTQENAVEMGINKSINLDTGNINFNEFKDALEEAGKGFSDEIKYGLDDLIKNLNSISKGNNMISGDNINSAIDQNATNATNFLLKHILKVLRKNKGEKSNEETSD